MEQRKELAKIALAALILASAAPAFAAIDDSLEVHGTYLAAGCAAHGCSTTADAPTDKAANNSGMNAMGSNQMVSQPMVTPMESKPMATAPSATLTDAQLIGMLNSQGRGIFMSLDPEGKALAVQLASQEIYKDKNLAVKEAQRRMNERRGQMNKP